ncbi:MAG: hypothetical protein RI985_2049 [Chloroflexota bacterium]|jgi:hypothetical protein
MSKPINSTTVGVSVHAFFGSNTPVFGSLVGPVCDVGTIITTVGCAANVIVGGAGSVGCGVACDASPFHSWLTRSWFDW